MVELASAIFTETELLGMGLTKKKIKYFKSNFHAKVLKEIEERNKIKKKQAFLKSLHHILII